MLAKGNWCLRANYFRYVKQEVGGDMAYVALYREWRPKTFADIVGQKHISVTLKNALESERVAHAYLFCGPRGTGKTSTAKVLAKALNCEQGPTVEPCNVCANCQRINQGNSMDVLEIDAASNRGIDEIRDLREKVKFAATEGKKKVYIIDEVHMLTTEAFNALLKTLEEPPSHVVFILATTEPHKIPLTILSRCQRFDFRRISLDDIIERLDYVVKQTGADVSNEALSLIARAAEGGMRDALNLLDQCLAFSGGKVTEEHVAQVLGSVNTDLLIKFGQAIAQNDSSACLQLIDTVIREGKDPKQFIKDLTEHFRNLLLLKVTGSQDLVLASQNIRQQLVSQTKDYLVERLIGIINILNETEREMKWAVQPRILLEIALIRINNLTVNSPDLNQYLEKIQQLEEKVNNLSLQAPAKEATKATARKPVIRRATPIQLGPNDGEGLKSVLQAWTEILEGVKKTKMPAYALLLEGKPFHFAGEILTVVFKDSHSFHKDKLEQPDMKQSVERVLKKVLQRDLHLRCTSESEVKANDSNNQATNQRDLVQEAALFFGTNSVEIEE